MFEERIVIKIFMINYFKLLINDCLDSKLMIDTIFIQASLVSLLSIGRLRLLFKNYWSFTKV
jgi:hypothetical protein